jgi:predicted Zn-dependent protease
MAHLKNLPLYAALGLATACSQPGVRASPPAVAETQTLQPVDAATEATADPATEAAEAAEAAAKAALPRQPLTPEILFKFLVAEVAGQRGAIGVSRSTYLDLARQTQDPRIARRAVEVSMFARDQAGALEAARLWAAAEPFSERARQTLAALLLNAGQLDEAESILRVLLREDGAKGFMQLSALMGKLRDTETALAPCRKHALRSPRLRPVPDVSMRRSRLCSRRTACVPAGKPPRCCAHRSWRKPRVPRRWLSCATFWRPIPARVKCAWRTRARWSMPTSSPKHARSSPA